MRPTTDLVCLVLLSLWGVLLAHLPAFARIRAGGVAWGMGNRAEAPPVPDWVHRADRAFRNHADNLPLYAIAILVVAVAGKADAVSATAAIALVASRAAHSITYIAGVTFLGLRTVAYFAALASCLVILSRLL